MGDSADDAGGGLRLNKFVARGAGVSRRKADEAVFCGRVFVNGAVCENPGYVVMPFDAVLFDGKRLSVKKDFIYIAFNKPPGCVTSRSDERGRKTVMDYLPSCLRNVYPVGRLDYDTSGLLLLTNDGSFCAYYTHPKNKAPKTYVAKVMGLFSQSDANRFKQGLYINKNSENKYAPRQTERVFVKAKKVRILSADAQSSTVSVTVESGINRQVRKMFKAAGFKCVSLERKAFGPYRLDGLKPGAYRFLNDHAASENRFAR